MKKLLIALLTTTILSTSTTIANPLTNFTRATWVNTTNLMGAGLGVISRIGSGITRDNIKIKQDMDEFRKEMRVYRQNIMAIEEEAASNKHRIVKLESFRDVTIENRFRNLNAEDVEAMNMVRQLAKKLGVTLEHEDE